MALNVTQVHRNLAQRVTFLGLEFEDLFVVLGVAAIMNVVGRFVSGQFAGLPAGVVVQYGVPLSIVPVLMAFKYGKPRGYLGDWWSHQTKPHVYCGLERDSQLNLSYLNDGE